MDIQIHDLNYTYPTGVEALRGISLEIRAGARMALLGQNGVGKTTLVKHLNGLLKPARGTVRIGDWDTKERSVAQLARRVGFVFQNPGDQLFKTRVWDEVAVGPLNLKLDAVESRVTEALRLCELDALRDAHPYDLAPSQRRWVAIASVAAMQTPVVILDEPTTGQDAFGLARLARLLDQWRAQNVTVITVTHDVDFAVEQFDDFILMADGRVLARGGAAVFAEADHVTRAALDLPQLMRLAQALGWPERVARTEEFCGIFAAHKSAARV
jgi:energy-coupling factor transport system ATP-binding protein